jgi:hypothetical protein
VFLNISGKLKIIFYQSILKMLEDLCRNRCAGDYVGLGTCGFAMHFSSKSNSSRIFEAGTKEFPVALIFRPSESLELCNAKAS